MQTFELGKYLRASRRLDLSGVDFDAVGRYPLSREEVRCLTYMMDIETHTVIYLRDLLTTTAAYDPDVTAFLSLWVYEEFWHGEALGRFLEAAGQHISPQRPGEIRRAKGMNKDLFGSIGMMIAARTVPDFIALHMTWGAMNEYSTLEGYHRVMAKTAHPILVELLSRIVKDERRHYAFYYSQARVRLDANRRAQKLVRWALDKLWAPVGTGVRPQHETDFVVRHLFGDEAGKASIREMERELSKLPGLDGMRLMTRAMARAERRAGVVPIGGRAGMPVAASLV